MSLETKDLDVIERIIHKINDDVSVSSERGLERVEERLDGAETRIYSRLADLESKLDQNKILLGDMFEAIREDIRELSKIDI